MMTSETPQLGPLTTLLPFNFWQLGYLGAGLSRSVAVRVREDVANAIFLCLEEEWWAYG